VHDGLAGRGSEQWAVVQTEMGWSMQHGMGEIGFQEYISEQD
jgi:hypothetical protein